MHLAARHKSFSIVYRYTCRPSTSLASTGMSSGLIEFVADAGPVKTAGSILGIVSLLALMKYAGAIKRQLQILREESWIFGAGVRMERMPRQEGANQPSNEMMKNGAFQHLSLLELNQDFRDKYESDGDWRFLTLSDYLSQLRPRGLPKKIGVDALPNVIQREVEAGLAAGLLKALGPNAGRALLPAIGTNFVSKKVKGLATNFIAKWFTSKDNALSQSQDKAGVPVGLMTLIAISDANAKLNSMPPDSENAVEKVRENVIEADDGISKLPGTELTAMEKMMAGEVAKGPSFVDSVSRHLIPQHFIIDEHFERAIRGMEARLSGEDSEEVDGLINDIGMKMAQEESKAKLLEEESNGIITNGVANSEKDEVSSSYNPDDRSLGDPVPVNPRLFPDLHFGYGSALSTHTKRETLKMRLISLLLNKLGANYYRKLSGDDTEELFTVQMSRDSPAITTPSDFVRALIDSGHDVQAVPSSRLTTFGVGMCVKEPDGSWTNIPLGLFLESGYEDKQGNMAPCMLPHSGLDMYISGPLAGKRGDGTPSQLAIQHFIGIEGYCGWHSHANADVPFNEAVKADKPVSGEAAIRAARLAALYATSLNGLATELNLPFGGYGLTAVCNDSAAIIQQCLYGHNTIFPMTSIGRFMQRTMRYAQRLRDKIVVLNDADENGEAMRDEIKDLEAIVSAMKQIPSDINAAPSNARNAAQRLLHTLQPKLPFAMMTDAKKVMETILIEEEQEERQRSMHEQKQISFPR